MSGEHDQRGAALRKAGEAMLGAPTQTTAKNGYPRPPSGSSINSRIVRRTIGTLVRPTTLTTSDIEAELAKVVCPQNQRVQLHHFGFGVVNIKCSSQPSLVRRHSIEPVADLPSLRSTNTSAEACFSLAFSPNADQLAGGFNDGMLRICDGQTGEEVHSASVGIPMSEKMAAVTSHGQTGEEMHSASVGIPMSEKMAAVTSVKWLPGSRDKVLATTDTSGKVCLWDLSNERLECPVQTRGGASLHALCVTPDCKKLVAAGVEHSLHVYDIEEGISSKLDASQQILGKGPGIPGRIAGHQMKVVSLRAHPLDPHVVWSAGIDRKVLCWDLRSGTDAVGQIHGPQLTGDALDISKDGKMLLTGSHRANKPLQLFDLRRMEQRHTTLTEAYATYGWQGDVDSKGDSKGTGRRNKSCLIFGAAWDAETNNTIVAAGHQEHVAKVFTQSEDSEDLKRSLRTVGELESNSGFWAVAVTADAACAALGAADGRVHLAHLPPTYGSYGWTAKSEI